ncbi:MAG: lipoprotein [Syntrophorhabdus sp. PtaU1.Bin050]|nr:MAG: lipoprotein [Syntrophorhabdus sp. PtaU1.Bin050]
MNQNIKKLTSRLVIAALLFAVPASSFAFNEYDKIWHFSISSVFGAASETYLHYNTKLETPERIAYSTFLGIVPGVFKELYDDRQKNKSFDWGDMAANTGGALVGALISNYVNNKIQVSIDGDGKGAKIAYRFEF